MFQIQTGAFWVQHLHATELPAEPACSLAEAVQPPQLKAREYFQPNLVDENVSLPLTAFRMSEGGPVLSSSPPRQGQHSVEVLRDAGLNPEQIKTLLLKGVIR